MNLNTFEELLDRIRVDAVEYGRAREAAALTAGAQALSDLTAEFIAYKAANPPKVNPKHALVAVQVFPSYRPKTYGNHAAVLTRLADLGVKRMRHMMSPVIARDAKVIKFTQDAYNLLGIKSWLTMGPPRVTMSDSGWDAMEECLQGPLAGMVELVSGWNEPNHLRPGSNQPPLTPDWPQKTVDHNQEMYDRFSSFIPKVGSPQLWSGKFGQHEADVKKLTAAGINSTFNTILWHLYPRGGVGEGLLDMFEALYRAQWGNLPVICTEAGYLDAENYTGGAANLTPAEKARLVPLLLDAYVKRGFGVSYFELLDDPNPSESDREASLGLVECKGLDPKTWTDKPAFNAFHDYLAG